jgi:hypothetical protein
MRTSAQRRPRSLLTGACALIGAALALAAGPGSASAASGPRATAHAGGAVLTGPCLNPAAKLSVEENRLDAYLPENGDPSVLQATSFAQQMISGAGFQGFGPRLVSSLCQDPSLRDAQSLATQRGKQLWQMAVDRAQHRTPVTGGLPASDDRPLYWTRLQSEAAIQQWAPPFALTGAERSELVSTFDKAARGMFSIDLPAGSGVKRLIMSGFDPYTLDGGPSGTAPGAAGDNIRHGNPSGAMALALDGTTYRGPGGKPVTIAAYLLPVDYPQFTGGYLEDTVGPFMRPGPRQVDASVTVSQAGPYEFDLEQWNGRYHGVSIGNDDVAPCPAVGGTPQLAVSNPDCNISVVNRWGGPPGFELINPPQWTTTTLPVAKMIAADTGAGITRPPGDGWSDTSQAFGVVWHTSYTEFPDCGSTTQVTRNSPVPTAYPPPAPPVPPDPGSCAYDGGGGNYLSNESAYRNTLLRDRLGLNIPAGHIHTPNMQHFDAGDLYNASDATFSAWRTAIIEQGARLVHVVSDNSP